MEYAHNKFHIKNFFKVRLQCALILLESPSMSTTAQPKPSPETAQKGKRRAVNLYLDRTIVKDTRAMLDASGGKSLSLHVEDLLANAIKGRLRP